MLTKIPRVLDLSKQVLSTNRGMANTRMMMPSGRAKKLAETVLGKNAISPSLAKASVAAGVTFGAGLPLALTDPKNVGASFAKAKVSLQDAFKKITDSVEDAAFIPQSYFMQVQQAYDEEIQRQQQLKNIQEFGTPEEPEQIYESGEIKPVSLLMAEGGPLDMQETPMAPNLFEQMPAQTEEVTQAEMQEAQGALQQILQVIDMLIQQGLSAEEIAQFLEQYGISEDELEQAAQILGVDINQLLGGQMQQPQEPMMMAAGGPSESQAAQLQLAQMQAQSMQPSQMPMMQQPQMQQSMSDNEPRFEDRSPENQIFSLQTSIDNLMSEYDMLVRNKEFDRAQAVANEINNIDVQISQIKAQMPMGLGEKKN